MAAYESGPWSELYVAMAGAGATLLAGTGGGLYWTVPALLAGFAGSVVNAWVLLIEIMR